MDSQRESNEPNLLLKDLISNLRFSSSADTDVSNTDVSNTDVSNNSSGIMRSLSSITSFKSLIRLFAFITLITQLVACGGSDSGSSSPDPSQVNGLYDGTVVEQTLTAEGTVRALVFNGEMYILRDDQAMFASLILSEDNTLQIEFQYYPFSASDDTNKEFVGSRGQGAERVSATGIVINETNIVFDYVTNAGDFGSIDITEDGQFDTTSQLSDLEGNWKSTDGILLISDTGTFLGNNPTTGCNFEGTMSKTQGDNALFDAIITRNNCGAFDEEAMGFATLDTEGNLEFYFKEGIAMLFMEFSADTAATTGADATDGAAGG